MTVWGDVIGKHGEAVENENGMRLLQFCAENDLGITNSWFQHKEIPPKSLLGNVEVGIKDPL